jgi:hypothetical protein
LEGNTGFVFLSLFFWKKIEPKEIIKKSNKILKYKRKKREREREKAEGDRKWE